MKHRVTLFRLLAVAVLSSALLFGCDDDDGEDVILPDGQVVFTDLDVDGNGYLNLDEWDNYFDDWDLNDDGVITEDEWQLAADFDAVDVNGDGEIGQAEYDAAFDALDTDDDGNLYPDELLFDN